MARYLYSELASTLNAYKNCEKHIYTTVSVVGGWQTKRMDGTVLGPICNSATDAWDWQSKNVPTTAKEWITKHEATIEKLVKNHLPSGSGFDCGTKLDFAASHKEKLVFTTDFHHMNEAGYYDGWTEHTVTVTPSFTGINIRISGRNRNDIKDLIHESFDSALLTDVTYDIFLPVYPQFAITSKWEDKDGQPSQCYLTYFVSVDGQEYKFFNDYFKARVFAASNMEIAHNKRMVSNV